MVWSDPAAFADEHRSDSAEVPEYHRAKVRTVTPRELGKHSHARSVRFRPSSPVSPHVNGHARGTNQDYRGRGVLSCRRTGGAEAGIPSRRRARPVAGQGRGSRWSTPRLNDLDPRPWPAMPLAPTRRDTRAPRVTHHPHAQPWGHPGARPAGGTGLLILDRLRSSGVNTDRRCVHVPGSGVVCC